MKKAISTTLLASFTTFAAPVYSESVTEVFNGVKFGDALSEVSIKIKSKCGTLNTVSIAPPTLPVAEKSQHHLICLNYKVDKTTTIGEVAFTFGDEQLKMVEANTGIMTALTNQLSEKFFAFNQYKAYLEQMVVAEPGKDRAWFLTPETLHPHLFLWHNPDLPTNKHAGNKKQIADYASDATMPTVLKFGQSLSQLKPKLEQACQLTSTDQIKEPWLANKPTNQTQVNCYGYEFAGFTRKIEAVFGDDILQQAWILTGKGEEDRIRKMLTKSYGKPVYVSDKYEAFNDWQIALRKDKPEVLVVSKTLAEIFAKRYQ